VTESLSKAGSVFRRGFGQRTIAETKGATGVLELTGQGLETATVAAFALQPFEVSLADEALRNVAASYEQAVRLSSERPVYGRSTGVGGNRLVAVLPGELAAQALLASHATSAGELRSAERVRATLLVRLNQLCAGGAGLRPVVVEALCDLVNSGALPPIRELSGIGTGDLSALATIGLMMQERSGGELVFGMHDTLPFLSSNAATLADAALAVDRLRRLADASLLVAALVFTAMDGNAEAFSAPVELATPFTGARLACRELRSLLPNPPAPRRIQDPYGLRALPQVHGVLLDSLAALTATVDAYINAPIENPLVLPDGSLAHHGGFYVGYLAAAADAAKTALSSCAGLALTRLTYLSEPLHTGLEPFLGDGTPGASGVMIGEYVAAAALARLRAAASPASVQTITLSRSVEDDASFASLGARQLLDVVDDFAAVLAAELVAAVRAVRQKGVAADSLSSELRTALTVCARLPESAVDRDQTGDIAMAQELLRELAQITSSSGRSSSA